jgi:NifB/MoaA-like Fe-S oxidoreductase
MIKFVICTICTKFTCSHANECFRLRASPDSENQRYEPFIGLCNEEDDYHFFLKIKEGDKVI